MSLWTALARCHHDAPDPEGAHDARPLSRAERFARGLDTSYLEKRTKRSTVVPSQHQRRDPPAA